MGRCGHDLVERQIPMRDGGKERFRYLPDEVRERPPGSFVVVPVDADGEGVEEAIDRLLNLGRTPQRHRRADDDVISTGHPMEPAVERRQKDLEKRRPGLAGDRLKRRGGIGFDCEPKHPSRRTSLRGSPPPRPSEFAGGVGQRLAPKPGATIPFGRTEGREAEVRSPCRWPCPLGFHIRRRGEVVEKQFDRPVIDDRVVEREEQDAVWGRLRKQRRPPQRRRRQVEGNPGVGPQCRLDYRRVDKGLFRPRHRHLVDQRNPLDRAIVPGLERGSQGRMTRHHPAE